MERVHAECCPARSNSGQGTRIVDSTPPTVSGVAVSNLLLFIYYRVLFQAIDRIEVE
jgi:hypothetical protein